VALPPTALLVTASLVVLGLIETVRRSVPRPTGGASSMSRPRLAAVGTDLSARPRYRERRAVEMHLLPLRAVPDNDGSPLSTGSRLKPACRRCPNSNRSCRREASAVVNLPRESTVG